MMAISWQFATRFNRSLGGSVGLYADKNVRFFWRTASGVGFPYVDINRSKILSGSMVKFHPMVFGDDKGAVLYASLTCVSRMLKQARQMFVPVSW